MHVQIIRIAESFSSFSRFLLAVVLAVAAPCVASLSAQAPVAFDVNQLVVAQPTDLSTVSPQWHGNKLVAIELIFSTFVDSQFSGSLDEVVFTIRCQRDAVQVSEFWPKTEMVSPYVGSIEVTRDLNRQKSANIRGAAAYPGVGWIEGDASYNENLLEARVYEEKPDFELLSASGTLDRRTGAFFKFRRTPQNTLEGSTKVQLILEVPSGWRGDTLLVSMQGFGTTVHNRSTIKQLGQSHVKVALFNEGDEVASQVALGYIQLEKRLVQVAAGYQHEIDRRTYPTPLHKIGAKLSVVEPDIPVDWLTTVLYSSSPTYPANNLAKLPVDVRVAILDYLDQREAVELLANR